MEAPWAYHYAGRPDRTAEIVHAALTWQFGTGPGGLPGNDDSGGLSSWYVWASLGLFPVAGQNLFLVNAPAFAHAALQVGDREFVIETSGHRETPIGADGIDRVPAAAVRPVRDPQRQAAGRRAPQRRRRPPRRPAAPRARPANRPTGAARSVRRHCPTIPRPTPRHPEAGAMTLTTHRLRRRLVIVVRADPVICGHSGEARNLAEVALTRGFDDVRLLTWPIPALQAAGLPLKPLDRLLPYSDGHHRRAAGAGRRLPGAGRPLPRRPHRPPGRAARRAGADDLPVDVPRHRTRTSSCDAVAAARAAGLRAGRPHHREGGRLRRHQRDPLVPARGPVRRGERAVHHVPRQRRGGRGLASTPGEEIIASAEPRWTRAAAPASPSSAGAG